MRTDHTRGWNWLLLVLAAGFVTALSGADASWILPVCASVFAVCGVGGLVSSALLAAGVLRPSARWGLSPLGQLIKGVACLGMACIFFAKPLGIGPIPWFVGLLPAIVLCIGFRLDQLTLRRLSAEGRA